MGLLERLARSPRPQRIISKLVDEFVLDFFKNKRPDEYCKLNDIRSELITTQQFFGIKRVLMYLAYEHGVKGKIISAIHKWRRYDYPIISSDDRGKGYIYVTPDNPDSARIWDSKFRAHRIRRDMIPRTEREIDDKLLLQNYRKCTQPDVRLALKVVIKRYKIKEKKAAM